MSIIFCCKSHGAILLLCILGLPSIAVSGSWTLPKGTSQRIITYRYYSADQFYNSQGKKADKDGTFRKHEIEQYYERGVTDWLTIGQSFAVSNEHDQQNTSRFNPLTNQREFAVRDITLEGLSRIEPFARMQLYRSNTVAIALQPSFKFASLYANDVPAEAQADEWEAEMAVQFGHNFTLWSHPHYIDTSLGYRHRDGNLGNQYRAAFTLGTAWRDDVDVLLQAQHIESASHIDTNFATLSGANNFDLTKLQLSGVYDITPRIALQLGASKDIDGTNTGSGSSIFSALWLRF
jgi:protein XagA